MFNLKGEELNRKDFICEVIISFHYLTIYYFEDIVHSYNIVHCNCLNSPMVGVNLYSLIVIITVATIAILLEECVRIIIVNMHHNHPLYTLQHTSFLSV